MDTTFIMLESGALIVTFLMGWEMFRQRLVWRSIVIRSLIAFGILTTMIAMWRGH